MVSIVYPPCGIALSLYLSQDFLIDADNMQLLFPLCYIRLVFFNVFPIFEKTVSGIFEQLCSDLLSPHNLLLRALELR